MLVSHPDVMDYHARGEPLFSSCRCEPRFCKSAPKVVEKRNVWQRLGLGLSRFVRHTVCAPVYLLGALSLGVSNGFMLGVYYFMEGNAYERLGVIGAAPFAITFYVAAALFMVVHFPFRSFVLTMRDNGDNDEEMIQEYIQDFKETIGLSQKQSNKSGE